MKYYSEEQIRNYFNPFECETFFKRQNEEAINVRRCRECEYFVSDHPTIAGIGYCEFHTDFNTVDEVPNWWLCDENDFCNGEWVD